MISTLAARAPAEGKRQDIEEIVGALGVTGRNIVHGSVEPMYFLDQVIGFDSLEAAVPLPKS